MTISVVTVAFGSPHSFASRTLFRDAIPPYQITTVEIDHFTHQSKAYFRIHNKTAQCMGRGEDKNMGDGIIDQNIKRTLMHATPSKTSVAGIINTMISVLTLTMIFIFLIVHGNSKFRVFYLAGLRED